MTFNAAILGGIGRALSSQHYRLYACGHVANVHGWWGIDWVSAGSHGN